MSDWVFDSLICFLHSPVWNAALNTFIEEKSLVFDPNIQIDITDPQYIEIHNEYKNLVDYMLGSFMEELSITPEEFEIACIEGKNLLNRKDQPDENGSFSFHKGLFQQIWAANDMKTFVRLMVQRNIEIQLQALDLIERKRNSQDVEDNVIPEEEQIAEMAEIEESVTVEVNHSSEDSDEKKDDENLQRLNLFFEKEKVDKEDLSMRQKYLREQRDKILQLKKQVRARQLDDTTLKERPKSAKAAQKIIRGENIEPDEASIQLRKILAKKLREEVVDSSSI